MRSIIASLVLGLGVVSTAMAVETPYLFNVMTQTGASMAAGKRVPTRHFEQSDFVIQLADFNWTPVDQGAGRHQVEWRWYHGRTLVSKTSKELDFNSTPYTIWTKRAASTLGNGHFRIETVVDGEVVANSEFDIAP
jgi:hypothetical protein